MVQFSLSLKDSLSFSILSSLLSSLSIDSIQLSLSLPQSLILSLQLINHSLARKTTGSLGLLLGGLRVKFQKLIDSLEWLLRKEALSRIQVGSARNTAGLGHDLRHNLVSKALTRLQNRRFGSWHGLSAVLKRHQWRLIHSGLPKHWLILEVHLVSSLLAYHRWSVRGKPTLRVRKTNQP